MKSKNCFVCLAAFVLFVSCGFQSLAQTTVSTTRFTNNNANALIAFNFKNNNPIGVIITDIASICGSNGLKDVSAYYKTSAINGSPGAITAGNGWNQFGSATISGI